MTTEAPEESNGPAAPEEPEDELKIPADKLPDHTEKTRLDECLYKEIYGVKAALITEIGPVIGAHSGPGTLALFFLGVNK